MTLTSPSVVFTCPRCPHVQKSHIIGLCRHWEHVHKDTSENLYLELNKLQSPLCRCGCGNHAKFLTVIKGYSDYNRGHNPTPGFDEAALKKSRAAHKKNVELGLWVSKRKPKKQFNSTHQHKCPDCPDSYTSLVSLSVHYRKWHKKPAKDLFVKLNCGGQAPTCKCGCGKPVKFLDITRGFSEFAWGHASKVSGKNNWGNKISHGGPANHPGWKGGISAIASLARLNPRLYSGWKYPRLLSSDFRCKKCENKKDLHVHHDKEPFCEILKRVASENGWTESLYVRSTENSPEVFELKQKISDAVAEYHIKNNVSGIVLCSWCHGLTHEEKNIEDCDL